LTDRVVLGIDDTDMPDTRGTGHLARLLADAIDAAGLGATTGVTRHQLFQGPGVPMTSHNSAAAITVDRADAGALRAFALAFLLSEYIAGSDPGLAVVDGEVPAAALTYARRAQQELVTIDEAAAHGAASSARLDALGIVGQGTIGALCAVVLRIDGNDGRFVGLPGIRELPARVAVAEIIAGVPGVSVVDEEGGAALDDTAIVDTGDWVRPRVVSGNPVVVARRSSEAGVWVNADQRLRKD